MNAHLANCLSLSQNHGKQTLSCAHNWDCYGMKFKHAQEATLVLQSEPKASICLITDLTHSESAMSDCDDKLERTKALILFQKSQTA
jgi:hypothetical protein